ncbi:MAG: T9SS type A sorting domain-containing protein [Flavobacteriia bacterium]|nr:T9SS type A sorting domain-containing protein [Flavobacteriia bacterium]
MKKSILTSICALTIGCSFAQTTATDFTANDCAGTSHHLFSEMDQGKIIVAAFVMPCGSCAPNSLAAYNAVQSYASSNPNTVYFYLVDDAANTSCSTLSTWGTTNSMPNATKFSTTSFVMSQYGTAGMPKIVVMGGTNHAIVYNQNSGVSTSNVQAAIDGLLASASLSETKNETLFDLKIIPNPAVAKFNVEYSLDKPSNVKMELFAVTGELISSKEETNQITGTHLASFGENQTIPKGTYFIKITTDFGSQTMNIVIE